LQSYIVEKGSLSSRKKKKVNEFLFALTTVYLRRVGQGRGHSLSQYRVSVALRCN